MKIRYEELNQREKNIYAKGYLTGLCCDCKPRIKHDDADKLQGCQPYCKDCKQRTRIEFILHAEGIFLE